MLKLIRSYHLPEGFRPISVSVEVSMLKLIRSYHIKGAPLGVLPALLDSSLQPPSPKESRLALVVDYPSATPEPASELGLTWGWMRRARMWGASLMR
jgi:hypothetical protein